MEIMRSHLGAGMAYDALDGLNIHTSACIGDTIPFVSWACLTEHTIKLSCFWQYCRLRQIIFPKKFGFWSVFH